MTGERESKTISFVGVNLAFATLPEYNIIQPVYQDLSKPHLLFENIGLVFF